VTAGRKRKHDPTIPAHIDQRKLPVGCYWDRRDRVWYTIRATTPKRARVAGPDAMMSELHAAMELQHGINRKAVSWLLSQYHASHVFKALAESTQQAYQTQREVALSLPSKIGGTFGDLEYGRLETHHFQRLVARLAEAGTPTKANGLMRYLRLVYSWGVREGHCSANPVKGVREAKERKRRRLPEPAVMARLIQFAAVGGQRVAHSKGSVPPYLWAVADIAYLCRLRGIEVITLTDAHALETGLMTNRRKGSRDNVVAWTPRLRMAWDALIERRNGIWQAKARPVPMLPKDRPAVVAEDGEPLDKSSLDSAWQRLIRSAVSSCVIVEAQRFGLHDLKRAGVTDTVGNRADKQEASGHKSAAMMDVYDLSVPVVQPSAKG
jgi:site-specific recombinase XerC